MLFLTILGSNSTQVPRVYLHLLLNYTSPLLHNTDAVLLIKRLKLYPTISEIQTLACHQMKE